MTAKQKKIFKVVGVLAIITIIIVVMTKRSRAANDSTILVPGTTPGGDTLTAPGSTTPTNPNLTAGEQSERVKEVQRAYNNTYNRTQVLLVDGKLGSITENALREYEIYLPISYYAAMIRLNGETGTGWDFVNDLF